MYHATDAYNVPSILDRGFGLSGGPHKALGNGLYVSKDIEKTLGYGDVCFKLLVYPGKSCVVTHDTDPMRTRWHQDHSSAWIPANCGYFRGNPPTDKEETCVKSSDQVRILGIAYGHELLDYETRRRLDNLFGTADNLGKYETRVLDDMIENLGIVYSSFVHMPSALFLEVDRNDTLLLTDWTGRDDQLWSRTWDSCIENKRTGQVITLSDQSGDLFMDYVDGAGDKLQKWKRDRQGRIVQKAVGDLLTPCSYNDGVELRSFHEASAENWRFRCMDTITKNTDTFVNFTPWQNMITW